jgi:hypothetical protein
VIFDRIPQLTFLANWPVRVPRSDAAVFEMPARRSGAWHDGIDAPTHVGVQFEMALALSRR